MKPDVFPDSKAVQIGKRTDKMIPAGPMDLIPFPKKKMGQITAVLPADTDDQGFFQKIACLSPEELPSK